MNRVNRTQEQSAFRYFWNDGLLDLMMGLVILAVGLSWWQDVAVLGAVFPVICVSMWLPLRQRLVEPRMGYVEFSGERDLKTRSFRHGLSAFLAGTMILGIVLLLLWNREIIPGLTKWIAGFPLVLVALPALLFALFTQCRRFVYYAAILLFAAVQVVALALEPHEGLIASGCVISACGAFLFLRFLFRYPPEPSVEP